MSNLTSSSFAVAEETCHEKVYIGRNNNHEKRIKTSSNKFKHKCSKSLNKKLKKYKIRKNGEEDPDVLDVSKSLISSLIIKSPDSQNIPDNNCDYIKPRNYLSKQMGKRKKNNILTESNTHEMEDQLNSKIMQPLIQNDIEETHTNAFKLLMESRNKSIGLNSPGKEKVLTDSESKELIEKKEIKAKRMLSLQKMAEAKGSIKNQELEEHRDKQIKKQMLKRAERFKTMISLDNSEVKSSSKTITQVQKPTSNKGPVNKIKDDVHGRIDVKRTLQLCNLFEPPNEIAIVKKEKIKKISSEDKEFLDKLAPSIRKKENMMSYFKKVPKSTEEEDVPSNESNENVIKVKFTPKRKKKTVKKKIESATNVGDEDSSDNKNHLENILDVEVNESQPNTIQSYEVVNSLEEENNSRGRPKRTTKRPAKYVDIEILSSDEDLHIFTPKKKKNSIKDNSVKEEMKLEQKSLNMQLKDKKSVKSKRTSNSSKTSAEPTHSIKSNTPSRNVIKSTGNPIKLAPIFTSKTSSNMNSAEKEAKQKFLHSGMPEKLKKVNSMQQNSPAFSIFHTVVHIQQTSTEQKNNLYCKNVLCEDLDIDDIDYNFDGSLYKNLLDLNTKSKLFMQSTKLNKNELLENIKKSYEKFPVYRTYHLLKGKSRGEFKDFHYPDLDNSVEIINGLPANDSDFVEKLCWVDKYKPNSTKQIIGNFAAIDELKKWLQSWTENLLKTKNVSGSDGSDFSDFVDSDADSRDTLKNSNNVLIISGEVGSGKTSCVYAVAAELAIKVIEVNASSKRTGKIMLQDLQEATRSHKVNRGKNSSDSSQNALDVLKKKGSLKSRGRPKKIKEVATIHGDSQKSDISEIVSSQENVRTDMSLILIDDADIVFDQDDGFCSAISQLIQSSKRPVILVTSSLSCPHLQKFLQCGKVINMHRFLPRMLGVWLDIMCVADIGTCFSGLGKSLLDYCNGDIRRTINCLQFYMGSYKLSRKDNPTMSEVASQDLDQRLNIDDECSSMSWTDREYVIDNRNSSLDLEPNLGEQYMNMIINNLPLDLFNVWSTIPKIFYDRNGPREEKVTPKETTSKHLLAISNMLNNISIGDCFTQNRSYHQNYLTSSLWCSKETASVIETESWHYYNRCDELRNDISCELALRSATHTCKELNYDTNLDISKPGYCVERDRDKIVGRHHTLTNHLNPGVVLDRRALALDYWSGCRTICRLETSKNDTNTKRNNRFCHYLKSLNVLCKNDYFDALSKSLSCNSDAERL